MSVCFWRTIRKDGRRGRGLRRGERETKKNGHMYSIPDASRMDPELMSRLHMLIPGSVIGAGPGSRGLRRPHGVVLVD